MANREDHMTESRFAVYEGDRERLGVNFIDRSDDLLPEKDRFTDNERNAAGLSWLHEGPGDSLRARRRAERSARRQALIDPGIQSVDRVAPIAVWGDSQYTATIDLARRVYDKILEATQNIESEALFAPQAITFALELSSSSNDLVDKNMKASFIFSSRLIRARDLKEVINLQSEFAKEQAQNVISHARHILELNKKLAALSGAAYFDRIKNIEAFQAAVDEAEGEMKES